MSFAVAMKLARISNLLTVWTNVAAGVVLAGGAWNDPRLPWVVAAVSLFYVGGMFLNDAFDREFDARVRANRPIPMGEVTATAVFAWGFGMLAAGELLLVAAGHLHPGPSAWRAPVAGAFLGAAIVLYDVWHKSNPLSPLVMGACRMLVYVTAGVATVAAPAVDMVTGALVLLAYLIGLTYAAKKEHLDRLDSAWPLAFLAVPVAYGVWLGIDVPFTALPLAAFTFWSALALRRLFRRDKGDVPKAVAMLLGGICLLDATLLAGHGATALAVLAGLAFVLTLRLQRWVAAT